MERKFRAWYTHEFFELTLSEIQKYAKRFKVNLVDPNNPTNEELRDVYKRTFFDMSDPWEITANGRCTVEEIQ